MEFAFDFPFENESRSIYFRCSLPLQRIDSLLKNAEVQDYRQRNSSQEQQKSISLSLSSIVIYLHFTSTTYHSLDLLFFRGESLFVLGLVPLITGQIRTTPTPGGLSCTPPAE